MASSGVTSFSTFSVGCDLVVATIADGAGSDTADGAILTRNSLERIKRLGRALVVKCPY